MANSNIPVKLEFGGIDNISPVLGSITLRLGKLTQSTQNLDKALKKITFASIMTMSTQVNQELQRFSSKFNGVLSGSIDDSSNMEDNLNRVAILLNKNPSEKFLGGLNKQWKELSEVSTMSASEISDVSKDIVNSGVRGESTISEFTRLSVLLADASKRELNTTDAFSLLNEFKNSFSLKDEQLAGLTDKIVFARDHGKASYADIKEGFKYAAPTWGALTNATPTDYLAFNAELSNHGIVGSVAGTALRRLPLLFTKSLDKSTLLRLKNSNDPEIHKTLEDFTSNKHNSVLNALKINFETIKTSDKNSNKIDLFKALRAVKINLPKLKIEDRNAVIQGLFGQEALSTGLTAINFMDKITDIVALVENHSSGKAQELANSTRNTLRSEITKTQHAWDNFKISILDASTGDSLKSLNKLLKYFANIAQNMPNPMKQFAGYVGLATYGIVELSAVLAPVMMMIYFIANTIKIISGMSMFGLIISEIGLVINCFRGLTIATAVWNAVCALNPLVFLFMAISASVLLVINNLDWLKDKFEKIVNYIDSKLNILNEWIHGSNDLGSNIDVKQKYNTQDYVNLNGLLEGKKDSQPSQFPLIYKKNPNALLDLNVKFENAPQGTKVTQKTKNVAPVNLSMGYAGVGLP